MPINSRIAALLVIAAGIVSLSGCAKTELRPIRAELPLTSGAQFSPDESRRIENLPVSELLKRGRQALGSGDFRRAAVYFSTALDKEPKSAAARLGLGQTALAAGDLGTARSLIDQVLVVEPDSVPALAAQGSILRDQNHLDEALGAFSKASELLPNSVVVLTELAMTFDLIPDKVAQAEPLYRKVLELSPDSAAARNNLGFNLLLQGRAEEAVPLLSWALTQDPKNPRIQGNLATAYLLKGEESRALQLFRQSVGLAEAQNNIGYLYMTQRRWDQAEAALRKALELSPRYYVRAGANLERLLELRNGIEVNRGAL